MLDKITTLEEAKSQITKDTKGTIHLGSLNIGETHDPSYEIMKWAFEEILPPLKIFNWGEIEQTRRDKKFGRSTKHSFFIG